MITTYQFIQGWITSKISDERAASLVEYALLLALIAVVCIVAVTTMGKQVSSKFDSMSQSLN
jgi:pilus assembly protein Flp/PilA